MLFNSLVFALFLPTVFLLYWFVFNKNLRLQNLFIVAVSYLFYGWWDWRFLFLVLFSSSLDFWVGLQLGKITDQRKRKLFFLLSCAVNLGFLGFFKYYNFFVESFVVAFAKAGVTLQPAVLHIILPVGISFYTFQTLSYTIDVYRRQLKPEKDPVAFFAFVSFFPQLVAGPIERASHLLPQFQKKRIFDSDAARDGLRQMLWGFFKKLVIADNCAIWVNEIFGTYEHQNGATLIVGAVLFAFQIYGDFSGYSDIAIGSARLFGFSLMRNFAFPYFSRDVAEFWRRWHISLSTWFRDYVYIPLGGSKGNTMRVAANTFTIFMISGFWHGANWTFIAWGFIHACCFIPLLLVKANRTHIGIAGTGRVLPGFKELIQILITFTIITFAWIFFRSPNVAAAADYIERIFTMRWGSILPDINEQLKYMIGIMIVVEWLQREKQHGLAIEEVQSRGLRWLAYMAICLMCFYHGATQHSFIYFQF